jgi:sugar phosphate isomerase/epimerase
MEPISAERAIEIARQKGLLPGRVKGTDGIQFTKGNNERLEVISWDEFKRILERRGLQVYESGGWMKIMKRK